MVALKLFHPGCSLAEIRQQRKEMEALSILDHPGLVGLRDAGSEAGRPFVVTDLVNGPSLAERLVSGPLEPGAVRRMGVGLAKALDHVHSAGFIHRDIKPANVLLDDRGLARLADFGISRALDGTAEMNNGSIVGTAAYLAPEQVRAEWVGPPADVFALGLVLLEALTGYREYPGPAMEAAVARLHRAPVIPAELPGGLSRLLAAMTRHEPERRPTAARVAEALAALPASEEPSAAVAASRRRAAAVAASRRRRRRAAVLPLAAAGMLLASAGSAIALLLGGAPPVAPSQDPPAPAAPAGAVQGPP